LPVISEHVVIGTSRPTCKSIVVVGYDAGGMVAFACARDHSARIDGAVVKEIRTPMLYLRVDADGRCPDDYFPAAFSSAARAPARIP
jgi:pimeloyl-ACP methyl ester carboxylesterase